jgi:hypothetical protein
MTIIRGQSEGQGDPRELDILPHGEQEVLLRLQTPGSGLARPPIDIIVGLAEFERMLTSAPPVEIPGRSELRGGARILMLGVHPVDPDDTYLWIRPATTTRPVRNAGWDFHGPTIEIRRALHTRRR